MHLAPAHATLIEAWLTGKRALDGDAEKTITAYHRDLSGFLNFLTSYQGQPPSRTDLQSVTLRDMRAWMADQRLRGTGPRSVARHLSAVKSFIRWLSEREGFDPTAILSTRAPKFRKPLPRPVSKGAARDLIETVGLQHETPWIAARADVREWCTLWLCSAEIVFPGVVSAVVPVCSLLYASVSTA